MKKVLISSALTGLLMLLNFTQTAEAEIKQIILRVDGLACPFCAYGLEKKINNIKGVSSYDVDMKEGKVFIGLKADAHVELDSLHKAVKEAGFTLKRVSLRARGRIGRSEDGLVLLTEGSGREFLLFEDKALSRKHHHGGTLNALGGELKKKLIKLMESGKEVLIEGVIHEHGGLPADLAVEKLEIIR